MSPHAVSARRDGQFAVLECSTCQIAANEWAIDQINDFLVGHRECNSEFS